MMKTIEPLSKAKFTDLRKLIQKKYRSERKQFLVEGVRNIEEALAVDWKTELVVITEEFRTAHDALVQWIFKKNIPVFLFSLKELEKISDTVHSQGIIAVVHQKPFTTDVLKKSNIVVAIDGVSEPGNVGTIIRTCDWFGVDAVMIGKQSAELYNPKVVRSTMGSLFHLPILTDTDIVFELQRLQKSGFRVYVTVVEKGDDVQQVGWSVKSIIVLGNEAHGVSDGVLELADRRITIPRFGKAESLNVGIASGVVLGSMRLHTK